jgi:hypothetical protein
MMLTSDSAELLNDDTVIDLKDILKTIGKSNARQVHDLRFQSAYQSYCSGGEPLFTTVVPTDGIRDGVDCVDYIFFSGDLMRTTSILTIPSVSQLKGLNPKEQMTVADENWKYPPPPLRPLFNNLDKISKEKKTVNLPNASLYSNKPGGVADPFYKDRSKINDLKSKMTEILSKSYSSKTPGQDFWGGEWIPHCSNNIARTMNYLPNENFCSTHISLVCELELLDDFLSTHWQSN